MQIVSFKPLIIHIYAFITNCLPHVTYQLSTHVSCEIPLLVVYRIEEAVILAAMLVLLWYLCTELKALGSNHG